MINMDVKGISWVGNICQRFEAMCVEVDEIICEDAVKYVGDQMRNVKENVKKMYSEVMLDLLDSSSLYPLEEVKEDETPVNSEKPKYNSENISVNAVSKQVMKGSAGSENSENNGFCYSVKEQCTSKNSLDKSTELVSSTSTTSEDVNSWGDFEDESVSDMSSLSAFIKKGLGEEFHLEVHSGRADTSCESLDGSMKEDSNVEGTNSDKEVQRISGSVTEGNEGQRAMTSSGDGSTDVDLAIKAGDADMKGVLLNKQLSKLKLEESCVLVEKNDCSKSIVEQSPKSYKKKIRDVFSTRRWSKSKKDQQQLSGWYEEQCGKTLISSTMQAEFHNTPNSESFESDWELL